MPRNSSKPTKTKSDESDAGGRRPGKVRKPRGDEPIIVKPGGNSLRGAGPSLEMEFDWKFGDAGQVPENPTRRVRKHPQAYRLTAVIIHKRGANPRRYQLDEDEALEIRYV